MASTGNFATNWGLDEGASDNPASCGTGAGLRAETS